jgi:hypothetical protein
MNTSEYLGLFTSQVIDKMIASQVSPKISDEIYAFRRSYRIHQSLYQPCLQPLLDLPGSSLSFLCVYKIEEQLQHPKSVEK